MLVGKRRSAVSYKSMNNKKDEINQKMPVKKQKHAKNEMQSSFLGFVNFKSKLKN